MQSTHKDIPLEAVRGLAAFVVLFCHCNLAFFPDAALWSRIPGVTTLIQSVLAGHSAVVLFFVLSGYVLTRSYFLSGDALVVVRSAVKRWPRLAGPVLLAVLASYCLFKLNLEFFHDASAISGSHFLATYGRGIPDDQIASFAPHFKKAFKEGVFYTFFYGEATYDSSIWTMRVEFIGSFVVFGLALLVRPLLLLNPFTAAALMGTVGFLCFAQSPTLSGFVFGMALAAFLPQERVVALWWVFAPTLLIGIYLFAWGLEDSELIVGATLIILAVCVAPQSVRHVLSSKLAARIGWLSFPLYLAHILVITTLGSFALITFQGSPYDPAIATLVSVIASVIVSIPFAWLNDLWIDVVNRASNVAMTAYGPVALNRYQASFQISSGP
ncbi:acyltransferase [Hyphomicrobium sp.]|uniref:acyltransferase family protein n=1 Tax=Hyphomicrobium sp. TaxID=82 RepID=UPI000FB94B7E|nr:acyltransferase [Hyphomicrobium sp.]RUP08597.1 MAG: acyltransferase [Hyphomicrobium sp.]